MKEKKLTICLIDDDRIQHFIIKKLISETYLNNEDQNLFFFDGEQGINHLKLHHDNKSKLPDIILLDLNMPIMDGWQFLAAYEKVFPLLERKSIIYILSSSHNPRDIQRAKEFQKVSGYLTKPISVSELEHIIRKI
ncbi:response regulator [Aquimarina sp. U1-2]|uniref:response regulator n=1 Tax=Aquimarina sp. U1-2 TaxID=2823141 RepID=UPI001AEC9A15|nr:response regulator [Aquimarina sp. U1-2]MBP2830601.1 response regulator [Aquimarina sp. U1-2]